MPPGHLVAARRYQEAIDEARGLLASCPDVSNARHFLAKALWMTGRHEEAIADFGRLWGPGGRERAGARARRHVPPRRPSSGDAGSRELPRRAGGNVLRRRSHRGRGVLRDMYEESALAFPWLEKAFARRAPGLLHVPVDPFFDPIRSDPRIDDLCRRVGLPHRGLARTGGLFRRRGARVAVDEACRDLPRLRTLPGPYPTDTSPARHERAGPSARGGSRSASAPRGGTSPGPGRAAS